MKPENRQVGTETFRSSYIFLLKSNVSEGPYGALLEGGTNPHAQKKKQVEIISLFNNWQIIRAYSPILFFLTFHSFIVLASDFSLVEVFRFRGTAYGAVDEF